MPSVLLEHPSDPYEHLFICLLEVPLDQLQKMVEFIYLGEVKIPEEELADFLDLVKSLRRRNQIQKKTLSMQDPLSLLRKI